MKVQLIAMGAIVLLLAGCGTKTDSETVENVTVENATVKSEVTEEDLLAQLSDAEKSWMNISQAQYIEDFDWLFSEMQDNYPYFHVVYRKTGVDIEEAYTESRKKIEACTNDVEFVNTVKEFAEQLEYVGHFSWWGYRYMSEVENMKQTIIQFPEYKEQLTPYLTKLDNPVSKKNYEEMQTFYENLNAEVEKANEEVTAVPAEAVDDGVVMEAANVETKILQDGKTAYVKINGFDMSNYEAEKEVLLSFYNSVLEYDNLIIDITDNYGGGMDYFNDLVVAPLIDETLTVPTYALVKNGQNNRDFLLLDAGMKSGEWKDIASLPELAQISEEDLNDLDLFMQGDYVVEPLNTGTGYEGRIWLLVGPNNYSSSEYAAMFSKYSGFATLVGAQTGGDGIGVDPAYIILPNSGLVVQYSPVYGVTQDGIGSEEFGTTPDVVSQEGESALDTCLKAIASEE